MNHLLSQFSVLLLFTILLGRTSGKGLVTGAFHLLRSEAKNGLDLLRHDLRLLSVSFPFSFSISIVLEVLFGLLFRWRQCGLWLRSALVGAMQVLLAVGILQLEMREVKLGISQREEEWHWQQLMTIKVFSQLIPMELLSILLRVGFALDQALKVAIVLMMAMSEVVVEAAIVGVELGDVYHWLMCSCRAAELWSGWFFAACWLLWQVLLGSIDRWLGGRVC